CRSCDARTRCEERRRHLETVRFSVAGLPGACPILRDDRGGLAHADVVQAIRRSSCAREAPDPLGITMAPGGARRSRRDPRAMSERHPTAETPTTAGTFGDRSFWTGSEGEADPAPHEGSRHGDEEQTEGQEAQE